MGYIIKGAKKINAFKQELIENKYGIIQDSKAVWDIIISPEKEVGLSNEEYGIMTVLVLVEDGQFVNEKLQQLAEKYGIKL